MDGAGRLRSPAQDLCDSRGLEYADKTIFIDTDTVFLKDPPLLFERVTEDRYLMDQLEFKWAEAARRREYAGLCVNTG